MRGGARRHLGLFGVGTSGEGCDAADLRLPGRPYELGRQIDRLSAAVCAFPGGEGGPAVWPTDGTCRLSVPLHNGSDRDGREVVQVYLRDPVAEVVRPVQRLIGTDIRSRLRLSTTGPRRALGYDRMMQREITIRNRQDITPQPRQGCDPIVVDNGFRG